MKYTKCSAEISSNCTVIIPFGFASIARKHKKGKKKEIKNKKLNN